MRNFLFFALSILVLAGSAQIPADAARGKSLPAQITPPPAIEEKFKNEHPSVTPTWSMDGQNFKAEFIDPATFKGNSIVYDKEGNVMRRENEMENSSYPQGINDFYIKKYPGEKFKTWSSQDNSGERSYFIRRDNEIVWFDKEGNYIDPQKKESRPLRH
jgi:hypothetical protein